MLAEALLLRVRRIAALHAGHAISRALGNSAAHGILRDTTCLDRVRRTDPAAPDALIRDRSDEPISFHGGEGSQRRTCSRLWLRLWAYPAGDVLFLRSGTAICMRPLDGVPRSLPSRRNAGALCP